VATGGGATVGKIAGQQLTRTHNNCIKEVKREKNDGFLALGVID